MIKAQNKQMHLILPVLRPLKILKFCYLFIVLCTLSCGNEKAEKKSNLVQETDQIKDDSLVTKKSKTILCFGDSITAGYGLDDENDAYPAIIQSKIDSLALHYTVINSGLSGETTAGGKSRVSWVLNQDIDIFLLELGANDGLRGVPLSETRANLESIITTVKEKSPKSTIVLAGMELPPNMGEDYTTEFRSIFANLAKKYNLKFIPFILKDVGGIAELNQSDGIHPTAQGHKIVANTVWETIKPLLR